MVVGPPKPDPYICLLFFVFSNVYHFTCTWPRALKLGCITNVNMLFLTMGFICLFYENKFMLISGGHISNRSMEKLAGDLLFGLMLVKLSTLPMLFIQLSQAFWSVNRIINMSTLNTVLLLISCQTCVSPLIFFFLLVEMKIVHLPSAE